MSAVKAEVTLFHSNCCRQAATLGINLIKTVAKPDAKIATRCSWKIVPPNPIVGA